MNHQTAKLLEKIEEERLPVFRVLRMRRQRTQFRRSKAPTPPTLAPVEAEVEEEVQAPALEGERAEEEALATNTNQGGQSTPRSPSCFTAITKAQE